MTNRAITCLITLFFGAPACTDLGIPANGQRSTETRDLTGFTRVDSRHSLDLQVEQGWTPPSPALVGGTC